MTEETKIEHVLFGVPVHPTPLRIAPAFVIEQKITYRFNLGIQDYKSGKPVHRPRCRDYMRGYIFSWHHNEKSELY